MQYWIDFLNEIPGAVYALIGTMLGVLLAGVYAHFNNTRLKELEYTNSFYQKLTEKRLELYKDIEAAIAPIRECQHSVDRREIYLAAVVVPGKFCDNSEKIQEICFKRGWLGESTREKLDLLNAEMMRIAKGLSNKMSDAELLDIAIQEREGILNLVADLSASLHSDYFELHDIKSLNPSRTALTRLRDFAQSQTQRLKPRQRQELKPPEQAGPSTKDNPPESLR